ncbi:DNA/RNA helicase domain-containing protein [Bacillus cereus]
MSTLNRIKVANKEFKFPIKELPEHLHLKSTVYILFDNDKTQIYIGITTSVKTRSVDHFNDVRKKGFDKMLVFSGVELDEAIARGVESKLLKLILADGKYSRSQIINSRLNQNIPDQIKIMKKVDWFVEEIWNHMYENKFVLTKNLDIVTNNLLFKYSPFTCLDKFQQETLEDIITNLVSETPVKSISDIIGGPGTGKSLLVIKLVFELVYTRGVSQDRISIYVPQVPNHKKIIQLLKLLDLTRVKVLRGKKLVNGKFDILIVDEAHRMKKYYAKQANVLKYLNKGDYNDLSIAFNNSNHLIVLRDSLQFVRPSDINHKEFNNLIDHFLKEDSVKYKRYILNEQHRIHGGNEYINFIEKFLGIERIESRIDLTNDECENFGEYNIREAQNVKQLHEVIKDLDQECSLCRIAAGYYVEWASKRFSKKIVRDPYNRDIIYDFDFDGYKLIWNSTDEEWVSSNNSVNEVGCVHTLQGADLNYCGVIIGDDVYYDIKTNRLEINVDKVKDRNAIPIGFDGQSESYEELREYVLNAYYVLLTRGIRGTFVYFVDKTVTDHFYKVKKNYQ